MSRQKERCYHIIATPKDGGESANLYTYDEAGADEWFDAYVADDKTHIVLMLDDDEGVCLRHWRSKGE